MDLCKLKGTERLLDLACGYGRHALEFARRGYCADVKSILQLARKSKLLRF